MDMNKWLRVNYSSWRIEFDCDILVSVLYRFDTAYLKYGGVIAELIKFKGY